MIHLDSFLPQPIKVAVFDFDGTLSTLRCGWERVMEPMMLEFIAGEHPDEATVREVREYISASTGIQTILQMKHLCEMVASHGGKPLSPWEYKAEYNRRLMENVSLRRREASEGKREAYLMVGAEDFLRALKARGVRMFAASGTDDADVKEEARTLGLFGYFDEIAGAMPMSEGCSKEATLRRLIEEGGSEGLLVVGDGPVEIRLGRQVGAVTLGGVGNEETRRGVDPIKVDRLTAAGAHLLIDCFADPERILYAIEKGEEQ